MARKTRLNLRTVKRHERGKMNGYEQKFAQLLHEHTITEQHINGIELNPLPVIPFSWKFEPISLALADLKTTYRPDFYVVTTSGQIVYFEVKARTKAGKVLLEDAGRVKFKVAASEYPEFRFVVASYSSTGGWKFEEYEL